MQRIFNALIQYRNAIIYLILLGISLFYLNGNSNFHQNQLEKYGLYFSQSIYNLTYSVSKYFDLKKVNSDLFEENRILRSLGSAAVRSFKNIKYIYHEIRSRLFPIFYFTILFNMHVRNRSEIRKCDCSSYRNTTY